MILELSAQLVGCDCIPVSTNMEWISDNSTETKQHLSL